MKIYDISQEVFDCTVFPGDPQPERILMQKIDNGDVCNLTGIKMCAHNGTHVDAPYHFINGSKTIDKVDLDKFIGLAYVTAFEGQITANDAARIMEKAKEADNRYALPDDKPSLRILVKGKAVVSEGAAEVFANSNIKLFGNESQTVGPEDAPKNVHLIMLSKEIVLLEGISLAGVSEGVYMLNAAPLNLGASDGAPCRAVLMTV